MTHEQVDSIMQTIPELWRYRWCGGESGPCACLGCVQIGNRLIMAEKVLARPFIGDPEHIDETRVPENIFSEFKLSKADWDAWKMRQVKGA